MRTPHFVAFALYLVFEGVLISSALRACHTHSLLPLPKTPHSAPPPKSPRRKFFFQKIANKLNRENQTYCQYMCGEYGMSWYNFLNKFYIKTFQSDPKTALKIFFKKRLINQKFALCLPHHFSQKKKRGLCNIVNLTVRQKPSLPLAKTVFLPVYILSIKSQACRMRRRALPSSVLLRMERY